MKALLSVLLAVLLSGCATANPWHVHREPLNLLPLPYFRWWKELEQCMGLTGSIKKVRFYVHPNPTFRVKALNAAGDTVWVTAIGLHQYQNSPHGEKLKRTIIVIAKPYIEYEGTVKHEMAHALLYQQVPSVYGHPWLYGARCNLEWWADPPVETTK